MPPEVNVTRVTEKSNNNLLLEQHLYYHKIYPSTTIHYVSTIVDDVNGMHVQRKT